MYVVYLNIHTPFAIKVPWYWTVKIALDYRLDVMEYHIVVSGKWLYV